MQRQRRRRLVQICDGYDVGSIGWAVADPCLQPAGARLRIGVPVVERRGRCRRTRAGPVGDRFGRRPLLLASVAIVGISSLLNAFSGSIATLSLWRFGSTRQAALLARLGVAHGQADPQVFDLACGNPVKTLFSRGYALQTVSLWIVYFCSLMNLFLFVYWLPEVLHLVGLTPAQAVFACGKLYPARMRTSGLGWVIGVGRVCSVVAPMLGGYLLSIGLPPSKSFSAPA